MKKIDYFSFNMFRKYHIFNILMNNVYGVLYPLGYYVIIMYSHTGVKHAQMDSTNFLYTPMDNAHCFRYIPLHTSHKCKQYRVQQATYSASVQEKADQAHSLQHRIVLCKMCQKNIFSLKILFEMNSKATFKCNATLSFFVIIAFTLNLSEEGYLMDHYQSEINVGF